jgi:thiamine-monophosphate kinase
MPMDEFELIARFFERASADADVLVGVGDDGAVLRPSSGLDLVTVVDTMVEGVHYPVELPAADVGYRALAVNLSDLAAMGSRPRWMTLALSLREADPAWLADDARGLFEAAQEFDVTLVGGDTTRAQETVMSIQVTGEIEPGRALTRSGAKPGDGIYVTGTVGDAAAGLEILQHRVPPGEFSDYLVKRFSRPTARVAAGRQLAGKASAAIDLSDGLFTDLEKLATASGVGVELDLDSLPVSAALRHSANRDKVLSFALAGGDDYEICFAANPAGFDGLAEIAGVPVHRIGRVVGGKGIACTRDGSPYAYHDMGYRHFS